MANAEIEGGQHRAAPKSTPAINSRLSDSSE
jgi:hypothetical protein